MKENHNNKRRHQKNDMHVLEEIGFGLIPELIEAAAPNPATEHVTLPRYEYDCLVSKVAVYDLLRDIITHSEHISVDSLRAMFGIVKREDAKA